MLESIYNVHIDKELLHQSMGYNFLSHWTEFMRLSDDKMHSHVLHRLNFYQNGYICMAYHQNTIHPLCSGWDSGKHQGASVFGLGTPEIKQDISMKDIQELALHISWYNYWAYRGHFIFTFQPWMIMIISQWGGKNGWRGRVEWLLMIEKYASILSETVHFLEKLTVNPTELARSEASFLRTIAHPWTWCVDIRASWSNVCSWFILIESWKK